MGDRPIGDRFELIPFLGKLAPFDVTAYRLAAALRVPLLVTFGFKSEEGYDFYARAPRDYQFAPGRSREEQLYEWALDYVREVEHFVKKYPDQWFNFYPFWSALPAAPFEKLPSPWLISGAAPGPKALKARKPPTMTTAAVAAPISAGRSE